MSDRVDVLCIQNDLTGIDFVQVADPAVQTLLRVFFVVDPTALAVPIVAAAALPAAASPADVVLESLGGDGAAPRRIAVAAVTWRAHPLPGGSRTALEIEVAAPGGFEPHRLTLLDPERAGTPPRARFDPFLDSVVFSFKQGCPSVFDCRRPPDPPCEDPQPDVEVDHLARDFESLRNALLDLAARRHPLWRERIPADLSAMLAEIMAALGDEFSYVQDRFAREAHLATATERRSLAAHAALVDYRPDPGRAATMLLDVQADAAAAAPRGLLPAGTRFWARPGEGDPIPFELGGGLAGHRGHPGFWVAAAWNALRVHAPDPVRPVLATGATALYLRGHLPAAVDLPPGADPTDPPAAWRGRLAVLVSEPRDPALPARRHRLRIAGVRHLHDPLLPDPATGTAITEIAWEAADAPPCEVLLRFLEPDGTTGEATLRLNIHPAIAGRTVVEHLVAHANAALPPDAPVTPAVEREGPAAPGAEARPRVLRHGLAAAEAEGLAWIDGPPAGADEFAGAEPDIELIEVAATDLAPLPAAVPWTFRPSLIETRGEEEAFTVEDGTWRRVVEHRRGADVFVHRDYASGAGASLRFGDGGFGRIPPDGTVFRVAYRTGPGPRANLPADTVTLLADPRGGGPTAPALVAAVSNRFAIDSGRAAETAEEIRQYAPDAFRARPLRAVRDEDYRAQAERLPWVQRAGAATRWTGSWLATFVAADRLGGAPPGAAERIALAERMDCVRQAGRPVHLRDPVFVPIDLDIEICVAPDAYAGQVLERVRKALVGPAAPGNARPFFHPDAFTFGTPLRRGDLEAAIGALPGVRGVHSIRIRARGLFDWRELDAAGFAPGDDRILLLADDPRRPNAGALRVRPHGGPA